MKKTSAFLFVFFLSIMLCTCRRDCAEFLLPNYNDVCTSSGTDWFPLTEGSKWETFQGPDTLLWTVNGTGVFDGHVYTKVHRQSYPSFASSGSSYYRKDSIGNIFEYGSYYPNHELEVFPGVPIVGLTFGDDQILSVDSTVNIRGCVQEHLLVTKHAASIAGNRYFKKGVGLLWAYDYFSSMYMLGCIIR
jgi:hypothetical protein